MFVRAGRRDRRGGGGGIGCRKFYVFLLGGGEGRGGRRILLIWGRCGRGYVALAVATEGGTYTREVETGKGDREGNMVEFAVEGLRLLRDVMRGDAKL